MKKRVCLITILCLCTVAAAAAQELFEAVKAGDLDKVRQIVERDPKIVNIPNPNGETILFGAVAEAKSEIAAYLISKGADVNRMNNFHMAPLHLACRRNLSLEVIRLLVESGADVNAVSKYQGRPLDMAYENGAEPVIRYLTSKGAVATALEFETFELADGLHRLAYPWGMRNNLVVSTGPDGALIIDTGFNKRALDEIRRIVAGFGRGEIRYIINTHSNWDHVAGNALAPSEAAVIGLKKLDDLVRQGRVARSDRERLGPGGKSLPAPFLMKFNGEELEIFPCPGLHSEDDILIHFPTAGVLCMGDLLLSQSCPAVREATGYLELLDKVIDVFPPRTMFVSGHGRDVDSAGLKKYRADMAEMADMVKKEYAAGRTAEDMIRADLLKAYKPRYSHLDWLGPDSWIRTVVRGLQSAGDKVSKQE
ncbi:MAG: ankyrin repeat domain-containing protein [Candidatus Aminicenantes bacterium]|nr:ankyrin repeat domain-containing protein [Candidatus Aminicenantes bacterium]